MNITIREAIKDDWQSVAELLAELGRPDIVNTADAAKHRAYFETYLARDDRHVFVADMDGIVVGMCDLEFKQWLNFLAPMGWIADMIVTEKARSAGIGALLLARAEETARKRGALWLALESAHWRGRAHAFYLREGWTDAGKSFMKRLAGPGPSSPPTGDGEPIA